jgi:hypothetical protein
MGDSRAIRLCTSLAEWKSLSFREKDCQPIKMQAARKHVPYPLTDHVGHGGGRSRLGGAAHAPAHRRDAGARGVAGNDRSSAEIANHEHAGANPDSHLERHPDPSNDAGQ